MTVDVIKHFKHSLCRYLVGPRYGDSAISPDFPFNDFVSSAAELASDFRLVALSWLVHFLGAKQVRFKQCFGLNFDDSQFPVVAADLVDASH